MELDNAGLNPVRIASAIHDQLGDWPGAVPVHQIARRLDIEEIREEPLSSVEGMLVTAPERPFGIIALNSGSSGRRRRFTISHELGHFLMTHHRMVDQDRFTCSRADMLARIDEGEGRLSDRHRMQEAEANRFAIELLTPARRLRQFLNRQPDLERVLEISSTFEISREAAARRYVDLHRDSLAVLFGHRGRIVYLQKGRSFPWIVRGRESPLPDSLLVGPGDLSRMEQADPADWLENSSEYELGTQILRQREDRCLVLLHAEKVGDEEEDDNGGIEDAAERFNRFNR